MNLLKQSIFFNPDFEIMELAICHSVCWTLHFLVIEHDWLKHSLKGYASALLDLKLDINDCSVNMFLSGLSLQWRHNDRDGVSNYQPHDCLLNRLFRHWWKRHQSSASLAFVRGIHRWPVNSPYKGPVTRKMHPLMTSSCYRSTTQVPMK